MISHLPELSPTDRVTHCTRPSSHADIQVPPGQTTHALELHRSRIHLGAEFATVDCNNTQHRREVILISTTHSHHGCSPAWCRTFCEMAAGQRNKCIVMFCGRSRSTKKKTKKKEKKTTDSRRAAISPPLILIPPLSNNDR